MLLPNQCQAPVTLWGPHLSVCPPGLSVRLTSQTSSMQKLGKPTEARASTRRERQARGLQPPFLLLSKTDRGPGEASYQQNQDGHL